MNNFSVNNLLFLDLKLKAITNYGLDNEITDRYPSRPVLEIYTQTDEMFGNNRIQILGTKEISIFNSLDDEKKIKACEIIFKEGVPCIIISRGLELPEYFEQFSKLKNIPILSTNIATAIVVGNVTQSVCQYIKETKDIHGILMNIFGIGVLMVGSSGIGKSETCLSLIQKGHQLISDDRVICNQIYPGFIIGESPEITKNYIELRGIGLVDIYQTYGAAAIAQPMKIDLVTQLKPYKDSDFERLGFDNKYYNLMETSIPLYDIPVKSGRNLSEIVETAVLVFKQKLDGIDPAKEFQTRLRKITSN